MARTRTGLTGRGAALLIFGIGSSVGAAAIGERDLLWIGLLLTILPLLALGYLLLVRPRVSHDRTITPPAVPVGNTARAVLQVRNESPASAGQLRFIDAAPAALGGGAGFAIAHGFGRWNQALGYTIEARRRGHFTIGPLEGTANDPFWLANRRFIAKGTTTTLRVTPVIWDLSESAHGGGMGSASDATPQRIGSAGQDDVLVREHRHGDGLRRVHWRMSAKQGDLMVRLEESTWDPSSTLIIDTRSTAHLGEGQGSSLEWCISALSSIAAFLIAGRYRVSILAPSGLIVEAGHAIGEVAREAMIEKMTDLEASQHTHLGEAVADPGLLNSSAAFVAATGLLKPTDAAALVAAGGRARSAIALVPDADAWGASAPEHDDACRLLRQHGWLVESYAPGEQVPTVWKRVTT